MREVEFKSKKVMRTYHVVYHFNKGSSSGFGSIKQSISTTLDTQEAIDAIREWIEIEFEFDSVILINWIELKE